MLLCSYAFSDHWAAAKGSYERRYERDFLFRVTMPVSHCTPDSWARRRSTAPHLCASPGSVGPVAERPKRQKVERPRFAFSSHAERFSGASSRRLTALHHRDLKLRTFVFSSPTTCCSEEIAPRLHGTLAPCSKSRQHLAPSTSASSLGKKSRKRPKPLSYEERYERSAFPKTLNL
jgi:hypothetical protein